MNVLSILFTLIILITIWNLINVTIYWVLHLTPLQITPQELSKALVSTDYQEKSVVYGKTNAKSAPSHDADNDFFPDDLAPPNSPRLDSMSVNKTKSNQIRVFRPGKFDVTRGLGLYGIPYLNYMKMRLLVNMYYVNASIRTLKYYLGIGHQAVVQSTGSMLYQAVMNCSLLCWLNPETGHITFAKAPLAEGHDPLHGKYGKLSVAENIVFELDHRAQVMTAVVIDCYRIVDPNEMNTIVGMIGALYSHLHVHWWANGVRALEDWKLAEKSGEYVQLLNAGGVYSLGFLLPDGMGPVFHQTIREAPLPDHHHILNYASNSKVIRMRQACRNELRKILGTPCGFEMEYLLMATMMHSADHYYFDKYLANTFESKFTQSDLILTRLMVLGPNDYHGMELLCRDHPEDPICAALYRACYDIDPEFADTALFWTITN